MTYAQIIGIVFVSMFVFPILGTSNFVSERISDFCGVVALACALACIYFGVDLLTEWSDPFLGVDTSKAVRGKGGLVVLAIRY